MTLYYAAAATARWSRFYKCRSLLRWPPPPPHSAASGTPPLRRSGGWGCARGTPRDSAGVDGRPSLPFTARGGGVFGGVPAVRCLTTGDDDDNNDKKRREPNFDRRVLQPAARGELGGGVRQDKHASGIPRLMARRAKAHLEPGTKAERSSAAVDRHLDPDDDYGGGGGGGGGGESSGRGRSAVFHAFSQQRIERGEADEEIDIADYIQVYSERLETDPAYYWREADYDYDDAPDDETEEGMLLLAAEGEEEMAQPAAEEQPAADEEDIEASGDGDKDNAEDEKTVEGKPETLGTPAEQAQYKAEGEFLARFRKQNDILEWEMDPSLDENSYHAATADAEHEELVDEHEIDNPHADSAREPQPYYGRDRQQPPLAFVEGYRRFLYVTGLPTVVDADGTPADVRQPVGAALVRTAVARAIAVGVDRVSPANATSGYVGFHSPLEMAEALVVGAADDDNDNDNDAHPPPVFRPCTEPHDFAAVSPAATLVLDGLERGRYTSVSLARALFADDDGSAVRAAYGNVTAADIYFVTATAALVRCASPEQAASVVESHLVRSRLVEMGRAYPVRLLRARRALVHASSLRGVERRALGRRLLVDGDMARKPFYIAHAGVLLLRNLDPTVTKAAVSRLVQPHCTRRRDVEGSVDFVTCADGLPTGRAYVGFDTAGEAEAAAAALGPQCKLGDRPAYVRLIHDRHVPHQRYAGPAKRPDRPIAELLSDLNDWEQYVDPADLVLLEKAGVPRHVVDEALRAVRYNNATFGALDAAVRAEALEPSKAAGQQYQDLVQLYVSTLKECLATPNDPGLMYEALHLPDEEIDLSIFDREAERQEMIKRERAKV